LRSEANNTSIRQVRHHRYQQIADSLRRRVEAGEFVAGGLLPSEADLVARYKASRVTVRRALEDLRAEGLVDSRQGSGWFVATDPLPQNLGRLGTIEDQLLASGRTSERRILDFAFGPAPAEVAELLGTTKVLMTRRLNLADGEPFALVTVWCPEAMASKLSRDDVEGRPFYELLDVELGSARQRIRAGAATPEEAGLLGMLPGGPVLRCRRLTESVDGRPVLASEHTFPAHRTEFVVDLSTAERSIAPSGLRLVDES
jgi:GntR family transcriptional regulator